MTPRGLIAYRGPSRLDGAPIVLIVTFATLNEKTGDMAQAWVLRSDCSPQEALADGRDFSICGHCVHRSGQAIGRSCYVITWLGPLRVYKSFQTDQYPTLAPALAARYLAGEQLRMAAYGDPAAFRTRINSESVRDDEIVCPASDEAGHRTTCEACNLCTGRARGDARSIVILAHGQRTAIFEARKAALV